MNQRNGGGGGVGFLGLLTIVFIVLKLTHVIDWSWIWVLSPMWSGAVFWGIWVIFFLIVSFLLGAE